MNENEFFSVIIPAYNAEKTIVNTINSVLNQTYLNYEIIVVNDGSTDKTNQVLESYRNNKRIKIFSKENEGVSSARNMGLSKSSGVYIVFVDSDDIVHEDYLSAFSKIMKDSDLGVVGYRAVNQITKKTEIHSLEKEDISSTEFIERILRYRDINSACWNKCFKREIITNHKIQFCKNYSIGEDLLFLVQYAMFASKITVSECVVYDYIISGNNVMMQNSTLSFNEKWYSEWEAIKKVEEHLNERNLKISSLPLKKVRISNKLLNKMKKNHVENNEIKYQLKKTIKENFFVAFFNREFTLRQKISILINLVY